MIEGYDRPTKGYVTNTEFVHDEVKLYDNFAEKEESTFTNEIPVEVETEEIIEEKEGEE